MKALKMQNQVNNVIDNGMKFYSISSIANNPVMCSLAIVTISLRGENNYRPNFNSGLTCTCDSGFTNSMMKYKHINPLKYKRRADKSNQSIYSGQYSTPHYLKVPFSMQYF